MIKTYNLTNPEREIRYEHIDVIRGLAILLVVLGHSIGNEANPLNKFILAFHMPLFFILSGALAKTGHNVNFKTLILKKTRTLLIPQVTLGVITYLYDILIEVFIQGNSSVFDFNLLGYILQWWFLIVLFFAEILFYIISKNINLQKNKGKLLVFGLFFTLTLMIQLYPSKVDGVPLHLDILPMGFLFFLLGYYFSNLIKSKALKNYDLNGGFLMLIPILMIISNLNLPVTMYNNEYGNLLLFGISSLLGIYLTHILGWHLKDNLYLEFLGKNSVIIYVLQFKVIQIVRRVVIILFSTLSESTVEYIQYLLIFIISTIILMTFTVVCDKYLGFLFGKKAKYHRLK